MRQFLLVIWISSLEAQVFTSSPGAPAHYVGWNRPVYDPVSRRVVTWWNDWSGAGTIYVNSAFSFRTSDKTFIKVGTSNSGQGNATAAGTTITRTSGKTFEQSWVGSKIAISAAHYTIQSVASGNTLTVASGAPSSGAWDVSCPASTSSWFGDRHTYQKTTIDTRRKRLYQVGGACSSGAGQDHKVDTWYIALNENPASATFNRVTSATNSPPSPLGGIAEYSPASDVIIWVGYDGGSGADPYYIFAPTDKGALSSAQTAAGASSADNWNALSGLKGNGGVNCVGGGDVCPRPGITITRTGKMVNRTADNKLYWFTTSNDSTVNQIWTYDPPNKRWQKITDTNTPGWNTSIASNTPVLDYDSVNDLFWYYLPDNKHLYTFNPVTNSWSDRGLFSSLPSTSELGVYDAAQHSFIVIDGDESAAAGTFWVGKLPHSLSVNLTIQEALYPGDFTGKTLSAAGGIARTDEPFCMGVPLKDIWNVTDTQTLGLTGASAGQFRALAHWPSGSIKWAEVCGIVASLPAGGTATVTLTDGGSGNFGGSNLATDGTPIVVSTNGGACGSGSAVCFDVKKANHNGIDRVRIGGTTVVTAGTSTGFALLGPDPAASTTAGKVTCSPDPGGTPCTNLFTSANDAGSTCALEVNGPVRAVVKCTFDHEDGSGNVYMHGTARYHFTKGRSDVRVVAILRNADNGSSNTFATAYKGHKGWEFRMTPNISGTLGYTIARHNGNEVGTVVSTDAIRLYQAQSTLLKVSSLTYCTGSAGCVPYTDDEGYQIVKTVSGSPSTLASGDKTQHPRGWMDMSNSSGAGVTLGSYLLAATHQKSLEWNNGHARIGLWTPHNEWDSTYTAYYQAWPQHSIQEAWLNFHASAPSSPQNDFLKSQHYLVGRASVADYNDTGVFPFLLPTAAEEDAWYTATDAAANPPIPGTGCCLIDKGTQAGAGFLQIYPWWAWATGGSGTQAEHRLSDLMNFIKRGMTGRFLDAAHFYRLQSSMGKPMSDGFDWRTQPSGVKNGMGQPIIASLNSNKADRDWADQEHHHTYGAGFYYFMTGDETAKDGIIEGLIDWHAHDSSGTLFNSRANGGFLLGGGILAEFLRDIGDSTNASAVLNAAVSNFNATAKADLCLNGFPSGCSGLGNGISRTRGARWGYSGELWQQSNGDTWCGAPVVGNNRGVASFQSSIFIEGLLSIRRAKGPDWPDYALAGDLAYGMARWLLSEMYEDNASGRWDQNGFHYYLLIDQGSSNCLSGPDPDGYHLVGGRQTTHATWLPIYQTEGGLAPWLSKIRIAWQGILNGYGTDAPDYAGYQAGHVIALSGLSGALEAVGLTGFTDNGGGSYTLQWTVPAEAQTYRVKYSTTKQITDWLNFNKYTFSFGLDPNIYVPWFAATDASRVPAPQPEGTTQSMTIQTGQAGLTAANFSVKAKVSSNPILPGNPIPPARWTTSGSSRISGGIRVQ